MRFVDWLNSEVAAMEAADALEAGGPVEFEKSAADGTFLQFTKDDPDTGEKHTVITNDPDFRRHLRAMLDNTPADSTPRVVRRAAEEALAAAAEVKGQVGDLSKRIEALDAQQRDFVEVTPEQLSTLYDEALDEVAAEG